MIGHKCGTETDKGIKEKRMEKTQIRIEYESVCYFFFFLKKYFSFNLTDKLAI